VSGFETTTSWRAVAEFVKVYLFPLLAVYELPNAIGVDGLPTPLPFKEIEDAEAPVNEVPTTRLFVPKFGLPETVMRFPMPLIATAPRE
jgi:hypothetical protein